jgi:hypothetical protein
MHNDNLVQQIYLNTRNSDVDNDWIYYRVATFGKDGDAISICQVQWPSFQDIDLIWDESKAVVTSLGLTGSGAASLQIPTLLKNRWNIDHDQSTLIGILWGDHT